MKVTADVHAEVKGKNKEIKKGQKNKAETEPRNKKEESLRSENKSEECKKNDETIEEITDEENEKTNKEDEKSAAVEVEDDESLATNTVNNILFLDSEIVSNVSSLSDVTDEIGSHTSDNEDPLQADNE